MVLQPDLLVSFIPIRTLLGGLMVAGDSMLYLLLPLLLEVGRKVVRLLLAPVRGEVRVVMELEEGGWLLLRLFS